MVITLGLLLFIGDSFAVLRQRLMFVCSAAGAERGADMQAVGVLSSELEGLRQHLPFLESESRDHSDPAAQQARLEGHLVAHGGSATSSLSFEPRHIPEDPLEMPPEAQVLMHFRLAQYPQVQPVSGAISRLIHHFRENLFVLWKACHHLQAYSDEHRQCTWGRESCYTPPLRWVQCVSASLLPVPSCSIHSLALK